MAHTSEEGVGSRRGPIHAPLRTYGRDENKPNFSELIAKCETSAIHLELHDQHLTDDPRFRAWRQGNLQPQTTGGNAFRDAVSGAVRRGVRVRRVRIVSEPVSEYVRWEHSLTVEHNIRAGEMVRWLPRALTSTLAIPGNPFWVFDDHMVRFSVFDGNGRLAGHQFSEATSVIRLCVSAFENAWELAIDHEAFKLT